MNMTPNEMAADIVRQGCKSKLQLKDGSLTAHVLCAFDVFDSHHRRHPATENDESYRRAVLAALDFLGFV